MDYVYHPMSINDYDEIYALWKDIPGVGLSNSSDSRDSITRYLARNPGQSFVCKTFGEIVGTILCGNDGRRAYIYHMAVAPAHRRRGLATELVRLAVDAQRGCAITKCHLLIINSNDSGRAFWLNSGFCVRDDIGIMSMDL